MWVIYLHRFSRGAFDLNFSFRLPGLDPGTSSLLLYLFILFIYMDLYIHVITCSQGEIHCLCCWLLLKNWPLVLREFSEGIVKWQIQLCYTCVLLTVKINVKKVLGILTLPSANIALPPSKLQPASSHLYRCLVFQLLYFGSFYLLFCQIFCFLGM